MNGTIAITVDGRPAEVPAHGSLLDALRGLGVHVPTLCHHPSLEPSGACRLCVVEVTHADWRGWSGLVTSCLYPVQAGLEISTLSPRVREARTTLLQLLMARCPDAGAVRAAARAEGVETTPFAVRPDADLCIACGLCIRVCQDLGPGALAALGRGVDKAVGPRPDLVGEDCTACGACEHVCPTGHIASTREGGATTIWNRTFDVPVCTVERDLCRACGICEEVCPLAIPRVAAGRDGTFAAGIAPDACVGCGICAGACPTGAIGQERFPDDVLAGRDGDLRGRTVVFACSRSPLPDEPDLVPVPCIGRVGAEHVLECLARGADGVVTMCRDRETCPYGEGGRLGEERAQLTARLASLAGLGPGRIRCVTPPAGRDGPAAALAEQRAGFAPNPLQETFDGAGAPDGGLDRALAVLRWLRRRPELDAARAQQRVPIVGSRETAGADVVLYVGDLPELALLLRSLNAGTDLVDLMRRAAALLDAEGIPYRIARSVDELADLDPRRVVVLGRDMLPETPAGIELITADQLAGAAEPEAAVAAIVGPGFRFALAPDERRALAALLRDAGGTVPCAGAHEVAQLRLLQRPGAWREARTAAPVMAFAAAGRTS